MAELASDLVKSVQELLSEKEAIVSKERELIESLDAALQRMGYRIVPVTATPAVRRRGRPPKNLSVLPSAPRRGRPPGSKNKPAKMKRARRRGRPRKA